LDEGKKKKAPSLGKALVFEAGKKNWACELSRVKEIVRSAQITGLPNALSQVAGVINVRGEVVPVLNFWRDKVLTKKNGSRSKETVVILKSDEGNVGLKVSQVNTIEDIHAFDVGSDVDDIDCKEIVSCRVYLSAFGSTPLVDAKLLIETVKAQGKGRLYESGEKNDVFSAAGGIQ